MTGNEEVARGLFRIVPLWRLIQQFFHDQKPSKLLLHSPSIVAFCKHCNICKIVLIQDCLGSHVIKDFAAGGKVILFPSHNVFTMKSKTTLLLNCRQMNFGYGALGSCVKRISCRIKMKDLFKTSFGRDLKNGIESPPTHVAGEGMLDFLAC